MPNNTTPFPVAERIAKIMAGDGATRSSKFYGTAWERDCPAGDCSMFVTIHVNRAGRVSAVCDSCEEGGPIIERCAEQLMKDVGRFGIESLDLLESIQSPPVATAGPHTPSALSSPEKNALSAREVATPGAITQRALRANSRAARSLLRAVREPLHSQSVVS